MSSDKKIITGTPKVDFDEEKKRTFLIVAIFMFIAGLIGKNYYVFAVGVVFIIVNFYEKKFFINDEGIVTSYKFFSFKKQDKWPFKDIDTIFVKQESKEKIALYVAKGKDARDVYLEPEDVDPVIELAQAKNPSITVTYI